MRSCSTRLAASVAVLAALLSACDSTPPPAPGATTPTEAAAAPATPTGTSAPTATPWPALGPDATEDRVGLPADYQTLFFPFYVFDRPDNRQVRVIFANEVAMGATADEPFPYGSVLVMETYRAVVDADGAPILDDQGRYQRGDLGGVFVMRKEPGFGTRYADVRTGEWEYASFRPDGSVLTPPQATSSCASCHVNAGPARDWVYRANLHLGELDGSLPQVAADQPADRPSINSYLYLPDTIEVKVETAVIWRNDDQVPHTVTAEDGSFSGFINQGATYRRVFERAGTFEFFCAVHPAMRGRVIVTN